MQADLHRGGFRTQYGDDESGSAIQYFRKGGGYYVNIGVARLIGSGEVVVRQYDEVARLTADGIVWADGSRSDADLIVFATGYQGVQPALRSLFGEEVAARVGPVWGFDQDGELQNMFARTAQPGLWFIAGGLPHARWFSRFTALQLQACELGLIPVTAPNSGR
jgi:putative flavoprotein involved in K+ transport